LRAVGPLSGRVTAKQINDAVQDALASGILEVHVLGWAFEANVGEVKSRVATCTLCSCATLALEKTLKALYAETS
jgi:hypothetical protein